jgi:hypothetical protein
VGYQGDNLFYLDPHFTRAAVIPAFPGDFLLEGDADDEGGSPQTTSSGDIPSIQECLKLINICRWCTKEGKEISLEEFHNVHRQFQWKTCEWEYIPSTRSS